MRNLFHWLGLVLLTAALLPAHAHAESLTFRSKVTTNEFTATISGDLSLPKGKGPFPVVILLHPCGGLDAVVLTTLQAHSRELLSSGFATLILDSYGSRNLTGGKMCSNRLYRSDIEVRIIGHRLEDAPPNTLDAPSTEASEHAVPIPKRLRKIPPGRARTDDPQHTFHEHPVVAPRGAFLVRSTYDQRRHPLPRRVVQNQPLHHTQDCLPKSSLESDLLLKGNP